MENSNKSLLFDSNARSELMAGVDLLSNAVKIIMGPGGQNVVIERPGLWPILTKDGVTVARSINLKSQFKNLGVQIVKEAASRTAEVAGDGTTTATVLTQCMINQGLKLLVAGYSGSEIRKGMSYACDSVIKSLKSAAVPITSEEEIISVGTISANGDTDIGQYLADAMREVGRDGVIAIEEAKGFETSLEVVKGLKIDRGYISPYFVTNSDKLVCELENPAILIVNKTISNISEILPVLENAHKEQKSLFIVADEVEGEALKALVLNHIKGILKVCVIRAPEFGESRVDSLNDLCLMLDTNVISSAEDITENINSLGTCKKIEVYRNSTVFIGAKTESAKLEERVKQIKLMQEDKSLSPNEHDFLRKRLARLAGGVAIIKVGGSTELEVKEKLDRVEDALHATQAAVQEGILPGGGSALVQAAISLDSIKTGNHDFDAGIEIIKKACEAPLKQIIENSGGSAEVILNEVVSIPNNMGYDVRDENYVDMFKSGIIDPLKVVRTALEHANSAASNLLSVGCAIIEENDDSETKKEVLIEN